MSEKRKVVKATSPIGSIQWFKLLKPDPKFKKYTVDLIVEDTPELRKIINAMDELTQETLKAELAKADEKKDFKRKKMLEISKSMPIEEQLDSNGQPTGKFVMKFRGKAEGTNKDKEVYQINPPAVFNAQAKPYSPEEKATLRVFNGSIGQVAFEMNPYALATGSVGVTLKPKACLIKKIQQADGDASQFGFSASELSQEDDSSEFDSEGSTEGASSESEDF